MSAKQLTLQPPRHYTLDPRGDAKGFAFGPKDDRDPVKRAHIAIGKYIGRYNHPPAGLTCSPEAAAVIGAEVLGVPVFPLSSSGSVFRCLIPQEI